jgi:putative membrane protein
MVLVAFPLLGGGMTAYGMMGPGMWGYGGRMGGWGWGAGMGLWMLAAIIFWGAIIGSVVLLIRAVVRGGFRADRRETPMEILDRRFAAGELNQEQYEQMRRALLGDGSTR